MRIAIDIDSTLHPYWEQLAAVARRRFGIDLPYDEQVSWAVDRLRSEQLAACVAETHSDACVGAAEPYPGAVETIARWHGAGHRILVASHRRPEAHAATQRWLERIGLPHDELHCSFDKLARCRTLGVGLIIDDSPPTLVAALGLGMAVATLTHPWNRDVCEDEEVVSAPDWPGLARALAPLLERRPASAPRRRVETASFLARER